ncbi:MAG: hypothetical protein PVJ57_07195 [Phycisphaerae bacterium]|jgi:hypothetical protein
MTTMKRMQILMCLSWFVGLAGCTGTSLELNPFLTLTEEFGYGSTDSATDNQGGQGIQLEGGFRREATLTFQNNHATADLNVSFVAWVNVGSIRTAAQQDALLTGGYVQLGHEVRLGNAFTLPVGTFVYNGPGTAGATAVTLSSPGTDAEEPTSQAFTLITPDVILAFVEPPVSCESVAFTYTRNDEPLETIPVGGPLGPLEGSTSGGPYKTLAQVDVYQCDPFEPGLFIRLGGGMREANEFVEGDEITFDFNENPDANGNFANVTILSNTDTSGTTP